jgi:hypothetical protein
MKKLSDYRIKEFNGKFTVETKIETEEGLFRKRIKTRWVNIWTGGCQEGLTNRVCGFDTLEEAKAKIVELCEEPTYHYLFYKDDGIGTMNVPVSEYLNRFKYKVFPPVILEINPRRISPADIKPNTVVKTEHQMKEELTTDDIRKLIEEQIKAAFEQMPLLSEKEMAEMKDQTDRNIEEMKKKCYFKKSYEKTID